jgi:hypothetical protein
MNEFGQESSVQLPNDCWRRSAAALGSRSWPSYVALDSSSSLIGLIGVASVAARMMFKAFTARDYRLAAACGIGIASILFGAFLAVDILVQRP